MIAYLQVTFVVMRRVPNASEESAFAVAPTAQPRPALWSETQHDSVPMGDAADQQVYNIRSCTHETYTSFVYSAIPECARTGISTTIQTVSM